MGNFLSRVNDVWAKHLRAFCRAISSIPVTDTRALGLWDISTHLGFRGLVLTGGHKQSDQGELSHLREGWDGEEQL